MPTVVQSPNAPLRFVHRIIERLDSLSAVLIIVACLRLPGLLWPVISDDEAIYDAMAHVINSGGVIYRDTVDHKPPGLAFVYGLLERPFLHMSPAAGDFAAIFTVHLFGVLLAVLTAYGLYLLARELFERRSMSEAKPETETDEALWLLPPLLYGIVTTSKCAFDGLAVNGELLMNAPIVFAILAVVRAGKKSGVQRLALDFSAGFLMGLAGLSKWQAMVAGLAFPLMRLTSLKEFFARVLTRGPAWIVGLLLPLAGAFLFFKEQGALDEARRWGLYNLLYISEGPGLLWGLKRFAIQFGSVILPSIVFYVCSVVGGVELIRGLKKDVSHIGLLVWALVSIWAVGLGSRFFGHYFLQAELPLCLIAAAPLHRFWIRAPKRTLALVGVPALAFLIFGFMPQVTRDIFDAGVPDWSQIGQEISQQTRSDETLFVWGNVPPLYYFSHRRPGTRFTFCNYLTGLSPGTPSEYESKAELAEFDESWPLLMKDLEVKRPAWILDTASAGWKGYGKYPIARYPEFGAYLSTHYREDGSVHGAALYRRIGE
jgi:hypothetical protein